MGKSCLDCPSYLGTAEASRFFKRSIGTPMCARYATPLMNPLDRDNRDVLEEIAENCKSYRDFRPSDPVNHDGLAIAAPDFDHLEILPDDSTLKKNCTSCAMCRHFVHETDVQRELGFTSGFCKAKGKLVPSNRTSIEARGCGYRYVGPNIKTVDGNLLKPIYLEGFMRDVPANDVVGDFLAARTVQTADPSEYVTDKPVTEEDVALGYRAWRLIVDPENGSRRTYLPIFDENFFDDDERAKIPRTGDDEHPELYVDHGGLLYTISVLWRELDETPALWGDAGTGKTELARHLAWLMCLPFERISITGSTELDDLQGKMMYDPEKGTYFQQGRVPKAWTKPCVLLVDEPNTGAPPVWQFLRPLTDNSKQLVLDVAEGQRVPRSDDCYLVLAMNPSWDPRNRGAEEIADADASRLLHVFMQLPPEDIERRIISDRVELDGWSISTRQLDLVMRVAAELRGLAEEQTLPISWGLRSQIQAARALRWFEPVTAYRRVIGDFMEPAAAEVLLGVVRSHVEGKKRS